jgi:uncharacterized damage-inducible protein DinB
VEPNALLRDPIRHNVWATGHLIRFCRDQNLAPAQLAAVGVGTFGTISQTLHHIVQWDEIYLRRVADRPVEFLPEQPPGFDELERRNAEAGVGWEELLAAPIDPERVIVVQDGARETRAGIFLAQAINHANHHREQVCAILTGFGLQPPDIQASSYALVTARMWDRVTPSA